MRHEESSEINYWALSFKKLAEYCREIAEQEPTAANQKLAGEAKIVYAEWQDTLALPDDHFEEGSRRAQQLGALRKRTIEMLVKNAAS